MFSKKLFLIAVLASTGCSTFQFDATEFDQLVTIRQLAVSYEENCPDITDEDIALVQALTEHLHLYAKYRGRDDISRSAGLLSAMSEGLNENMSKAYCVEKFKNIASASEIMAKTLGNF